MCKTEDSREERRKVTDFPDHRRLVLRLGAHDEPPLELVLVVEVVPRPQVGVLVLVLFRDGIELKEPG